MRTGMSTPRSPIAKVLITVLTIDPLIDYVGKARKQDQDKALLSLLQSVIWVHP